MCQLPDDWLSLCLRHTTEKAPIPSRSVTPRPGVMQGAVSVARGVGATRRRRLPAPPNELPRRLCWSVPDRRDQVDPQVCAGSVGGAGVAQMHFHDSHNMLRLMNAVPHACCSPYFVLPQALRTATGRGRETVWQARGRTARHPAFVAAECAPGDRSTAARCARSARTNAPTGRQRNDWRRGPGTRSGPAADAGLPAGGCTASGDRLVGQMARPQRPCQGRRTGTKSASSDGASSRAVSSRSASTRADSRQPYQTRS